jgi:hypothetical protein
MVDLAERRKERARYTGWNSLRVRVDDFAIRSFRDSADSDYITARMAVQARLIQQFLWSGLQAIEKYFKCIHVLNRVPLPKKRGLGHDIAAAYKLTTEACFDVGLSEPSRELIEHLNDYGKSRYYELPFFIHGDERFLLDRTVWEIRRFCRVFDQRKAVRDEQLKAIYGDNPHRPNTARLQGGLLEEILTAMNGRHPARAALIYQNYHFGVRSRKRVKGGWLHAGNPPLSLYPEMLDEVCKYAYLPEDVKNGYRALLAARVKDGTVRVPLP